MFLESTMAFSSFSRAGSLVSTGAMLLGSILPAQAAVSFLAPGLTGSYFDGYWNGDSNFFATETPAFSRIDSAINFSDKIFNRDYFTLDSWNFDGTSLSDEETFSVAWTGQLVVDSADNYTFKSLSDDGMALFINNIAVISNTPAHSPSFDTGTIALAPGTYPFKFYYGEQFIHSVARLQWKLSSESDSTYAVVPALVPASTGAPVPGPLPLLGVAAAFGASRRLRARRHHLLRSSIASVRRDPG